METLHFVSAFFVLAGIVSAGVIALDLTGRKQPMKIMNSVWVLTGLWASVLGLWAYFRFGRACKGGMKTPHETAPMGSMKMGGGMGAMGEMKMEGMKMPERPAWQSVTLSTLHCGAGCTLADIIGEVFLAFVPLALAGSAVLGGWAFDYVLALAIGVFFQFAAIRAMEKVPFAQAVGRAFKADILSLTSWQVGMYAWMGFVIFGLWGGEVLPRDSWTFWFMMQVAMLCGFVCAYPVNVLLIRAGIKKGM